MTPKASEGCLRSTAAEDQTPPADVHDIVYFRRHKDDDTAMPAPGQARLAELSGPEPHPARGQAAPLNRLGRSSGLLISRDPSSHGCVLSRIAAIEPFTVQGHAMQEP